MPRFPTVSLDQLDVARRDPGTLVGAVQGEELAAGVRHGPRAWPDDVPQPAISAYTGRPAALASADRISTTMPQPSPGRYPVGFSS